MLPRYPFLVFLVLLLTTVTSGNAATFFWIGGHPGGDWSRKQNWSGPNPPSAGSDLQFAGTNTSNNNDFAAGTSFASITFNAGAGSFNLSGNQLTLTGDITNNSSNLQTISLNMILGAGAHTFTTSSSADMLFGGILSGTGDLIKAGAGTLSLTASNTYTGSTTVSAGTLSLSGSGLLADSTAVDVNGSSAIFDMSGIAAAGDTIGSIAGVTGASVILGSKTLTAGGDNTSTTFAGVISGSGGGLTKSGTGKLTLSGSNTYTGTTAVNAGTLQIDGVIASAVTVNSGATLSGSGSVSKAITINGLGSLLPGNKTVGGSGIGVFTLSSSGANGNLSVASTATLGLQLGANGISFASQSTTYYTSPGVLNSNYTSSGVVANANDRIVVGGTLSLTGGSIMEVSLNGYAPALGDGYDLLDWVALSSGTFSVGPSLRTGTVADNALYDLKLPDITAVNSDYRWDTSLFASNGILVVVPEPSRLLLIGVGLMVCFLRRSRSVNFKH